MQADAKPGTDKRAVDEARQASGGETTLSAVLGNGYGRLVRSEEIFKGPGWRQHETSDGRLYAWLSATGVTHRDTIGDIGMEESLIRMEAANKAMTQSAASVATELRVSGMESGV